jgi:TonB family protein
MTNLSHWIMSYLLNSIWQVCLIAFVMVLATSAMRPASWRARHYLGIAGLVLAILIPAWSATSLQATETSGAAVRVLPSSAEASANLATHWPAQILRRYNHSMHLSPAVFRLATSLYLAMFFIQAVALIRKIRATSILLRQAKPIDLSHESATQWHRWKLTMGVENVGVLTSLPLTGPVALGIRHPVLLLPPGFFVTASEEEIAAALCHELAHVARHDFAINLLLEIASLPIAFHPFTRWLKSSIAQSRELACDEMAAYASIGGEAYARSLLRLAQSICAAPTPLTNALGIFEANILEKRIMNLIDRQPPATRAARLVSLLTGCSLLVATSLGISAFAIQPAPAQNAVAHSDSIAASPISNASPTEKPEQTQQAEPWPSSNSNSPRLIHSVDPDYTPQARAAKLQGVCVVSLTVDASGNPTNIHIVKPLAMGLDKNAVKAVRQYRFKPAIQDGVPIAKDVKIEVNFKIY